MKRFILLFVLVGFVASVVAQPESQKYRRNALYSIMISHTGAQFYREIEDVFSQMEMPDKFDNHDLSVKIITHPQKKVSQGEIASFLARNQVGRRMLARWFNLIQNIMCLKDRLILLKLGLLQKMIS